MSNQKAWRFTKPGDHLAEFDRLFAEHNSDGGFMVGAIPARHLISGLTVAIFDPPNEQFADLLRAHGWTEQPLRS